MVWHRQPERALWHIQVEHSQNHCGTSDYACRYATNTCHSIHFNICIYTFFVVYETNWPLRFFQAVSYGFQVVKPNREQKYAVQLTLWHSCPTALTWQNRICVCMLSVYANSVWYKVKFGYRVYTLEFNGTYTYSGNNIAGATMVRRFPKVNDLSTTLHSQFLIFIYISCSFFNFVILKLEPHPRASISPKSFVNIPNNYSWSGLLEYQVRCRWINPSVDVQVCVYMHIKIINRISVAV